MKANFLNRILLSGLFFCLMATTCKKDEKRGGHIYVKNNSGNVIYYVESFSFPDTTLVQVNKPVPGDKVNPGQQGTIIAGKGVFSLNKTFQIYVFDASVIETESWDTVIANYKVLKRYIYTEQDLEKQNWTITYP